MSDGTSTLPGLVQAAIERHAMAAPGDTILVACSGGPDSTALLHVIHDLGYPVHVAHFDHQTRDGESTADCAFVSDLAQDMGLPFTERAMDVAAEAKATGQSFEMMARELRYAFLVETARDAGCAAIATGHHANDQAETVLMRILRGTSPRGLGGIPPVGRHGDCNVIRPLIECTRADIEAYVKEHGLAYRTDSSNEERRFQLNGYCRFLLGDAALQ